MASVKAKGKVVASAWARKRVYEAGVLFATYATIKGLATAADVEVAIGVLGAALGVARVNVDASASASVD